MFPTIVTSDKPGSLVPLRLIIPSPSLMLSIHLGFGLQFLLFPSTPITITLVTHTILLLLFPLHSHPTLIYLVSCTFFLNIILPLWLPL